MALVDKSVFREAPLHWNSELQPAQPHFIPLKEQQAALAAMHPQSPPSWLNGFTISEGAGAVGGALGGVGGAALCNLGAEIARLRSSSVAVAALEIPSGLRLGGYGAIAGLVLAGIGYAAYKGLEYEFEPHTNDK